MVSAIQITILACTHSLHEIMIWLVPTSWFLKPSFNKTCCISVSPGNWNEYCEAPSKDYEVQCQKKKRKKKQQELLYELSDLVKRFWNIGGEKKSSSKRVTTKKDILHTKKLTWIQDPAPRPCPLHDPLHVHTFCISFLIRLPALPSGM